ncbi:MAG: hypothetical protein ABI315_05430 [Bacteroidia bacterium]
MECSRCKYKLSEEVLNYSQKWFNKPVCRNCQDWIRNNDCKDITELGELHDYLGFIESIRNDTFDNLENNYDLIYNNGDVLKCKSNLCIAKSGYFKFKDRTFQVLSNELSLIRCREISDDLFG